MNINQRIKDLRKAMADKKINAYVIPSNDAHQSEYVPTHWKGREWISGFTGSAGTVVVTEEKSGLWTDSRYFLQAENELSSSEMQMHKLIDQFGPEHIRWVAEQLSSSDTVGIDGNVCSLSQYESMKKILDKKNIKVNVSHDLLDDVWEDRPTLPTNEIFEHDTKYSGKSRQDKLEEVREKMAEREIDHHLITTLDDIAWVFNIRGNDVEFNPVAVAFAVVSKDRATLFIDSSKIPQDLKTKLESEGIGIHDYRAITGFLNELPESESILIDPATCSINLFRAINAQVERGKTIPRGLKAIKNPIEIEYVSKVMEKDGAAIAKTFYWLEESLKKNEKVTEAEFADKLASNRASMPLYKGESFPAIIGYNANGAIIHYRPEHGKSAEIKAEGILLADSGGQYLDGTTDITRTIALGTPTKEQKRNFTLVLKGMIALTKATFPKGTPGGALDTFARQYLWDHGLNYGHGTGHGVGFFLNVHEPPQGFAGMNSERGRTIHEPGMLSSNEPGYYEAGNYGIRIENLIVTKEDDEHNGFLSFDTLTLYPIDIKLIEETIFTKSEKAWLNQYHQEVYEKISPLLNDEEKTWFELKCRPMN